MPKKHSRRKVSRALASPGVVIDDARRFVKRCSSVIQGVVGLRYLTFEEILESGGKRRYVLNGQGVVQIESDRMYRAVQFYKNAATSFWLAPQVKIETLQGTDFLCSISVTVFSGNPREEEKIPLLRAEWDCNPEGKDHPHAQPHWHAYQGQFPEMSGWRMASSREAATREFVPGNQAPAEQPASGYRWAEGERFHYALSASWAKDGDRAHFNAAEAEGALRWLDGCIKYTLGQLIYLYTGA